MAKKGDFKKNAAELFISAAEEEQEAPRGSEKPEEATGVAIPKGYKLVKENKSKRMQLLVRPALKEAIRAEAEAQGRSMNDLVNDIFEEYLERKGKA